MAGLGVCIMSCVADVGPVGLTLADDHMYAGMVWVWLVGVNGVCIMSCVAEVGSVGLTLAAAHVHARMVWVWLIGVDGVCVSCRALLKWVLWVCPLQTTTCTAERCVGMAGLCVYHVVRC